MVKKQGNILFATFSLLLVTQVLLIAGVKKKPEELPSSYEVIEDDIFIDDEDGQTVDEDNDKDIDNSTPSGMYYQESAMRNRRNLWTNKIVPYEIDRGLTGSFRRNIKSAIAEYHSKTCIKFVKRRKEKNWVKFVRGSKCYSAIGKRLYPGLQKIYLSPRCNAKHIVMHEMMHTLGFWHEISRPDRDQYVEIMWENIGKRSQRNFKKYGPEVIDTMGLMYDYNSLLHYFSTAFSINGKPTIRPAKKLNYHIGRNRGFSKLDIVRLNKAYDCKGRIGGWSSWSRYGPCDNGCNKYRQRFCYSRKRARDCPLADKYGIGTEIKKCSRKECYAPTSGTWSRWSDWSECSTTCGWGKQTRTRECNDPAPKNGGKRCPGKNTQKKPCYMESRGPVHYHFMVYNPWSNQCLSSRGNKVVLEVCDNNSEAQSWAWSAYDQLVNIASGECLDAPVQNKVPVKLSKCCKEKPGQQWTCSKNMVQPDKTKLNLNYDRKSKTVRLYVGAGLKSQWKIFGKDKKNICTQKPVCKTKTEKNGCCVFPFKYLGKVYHSCTISRYTGRPWCYTTPRYTTERKWGYCEMETKACQVKTKKGDCCVFPFKFQNKWYNSCTNAFLGDKRWCSTTKDYDADGKWGLC